MKKRLLTALFGILIAVGWMFTIYTPAFSLILAAVAAIAVFEMLKVFEVTNKPFFILCELTAVATTEYAEYKAKLPVPLYAAVAVIVLLALIIMVTDYKRLKFEQVVCGLFCSFLIPAAISAPVLFRDVYIEFPDLFTQADGIFLILFSFFCAWFTDGFALFAGMALGKHKLAPNISPKKTVEGAVGGILGNLLVSAALWYVFKTKFNLSAYIDIVWLIVSALVLSVVSIFGDLAASTIKRHHGVKDFGNILPGHGGVMDRFDSSIFVFAAEYAILRFSILFWAA